MIVKCSKCIYYDEFSPEKEGWCRRYPPGKTAAWPPTSANDWCGEGKPHKVPRKSTPKNPAIKEVIDFYHTKFVGTFGAAPVINGAKDGDALKRYFEDHSADDAKRLIVAFLEDPPQFYQEKNLYGLSQILSAHNQMIAKMAKKEGHVSTREGRAMEILNDQAIKWGSHPAYHEYKDHIKETHEPLLFEEWLNEYR